MNILILKLGATGDVVRTTPLLHRFEGQVTWVTSAKNRSLLENLTGSTADLEVLSWDERSRLEGRAFDLVINVEDDAETARLLQSVPSTRVFGAQLDANGEVGYSKDSAKWFDLSLI